MRLCVCVFDWFVSIFMAVVLAIALRIYDARLLKSLLLLRFKILFILFNLFVCFYFLLFNYFCLFCWLCGCNVGSDIMDRLFFLLLLLLLFKYVFIRLFITGTFWFYYVIYQLMAVFAQVL